MPTVRVDLLRGIDLLGADKNGLSDPYVVMHLAGEKKNKKKKYKSKVKKKTLSPEWNQTFYVDVVDPQQAVLHLEVFDKDLLTADDSLGTSHVGFMGLTKGVGKTIELALDAVPHGRIVLCIHALDFTTDEETAKPRVLGKLRVTIMGARNLIPMDRGGTSDPFVTMKVLNKTRLKRTSIIKKSLDPEWDETFDFDISDPKQDLVKFFVYDYDKYSINDFMGECQLSVLSIVNCGSEVEWDDWLPLLAKWKTTKAPNDKERGDLHVKAVWYGPDLSLGRKKSIREITDETIKEAVSHAPPISSSWEIPFSELKLGKELGRGAFGVVFQANWRLQECAVKQIAYSNLTEKEMDDFKSEAALMMNLRPHKNIVTLLGVCTDPVNPLCIVTEFVDGGSLERLLRSQAILNWPMILHICQGVCAGMYHLHEESILHRDLAARNILLEPMTSSGNKSAARWTAQITDFGLSKRIAPRPGMQGYMSLPATADQEEPAPKPSPHEIHRSDSVLEPAATFRGPYKYMAPESLRSLKKEDIIFSVKTDVWSYGVLVWEVMSRSEPFPGIGLFDAAVQIANQGLRLPIPPRCPTKFKELMQLCWLDDPNERPNFAQIGELLALIEKEISSY